ncbi:ATP-binding cassette domain-containing protein [Reichenbachiella carrageenanivorans]|uniref:ATP-binding cassette domain-containing protein n=1 Tax=Reichenbachiella carrageenanivorans TaxID=2979869 RepID=A0ABY6CZT9_9BACT|nr:ATP-binding cassette domain-containing protein [Reichenbachiella carrageenanivorans]UXX79417.1 ATP-binding cassette domain-containing protein [Reichenbachiella carrageenanivorans]
MSANQHHWNIKLAQAPDRKPLLTALLDKKYSADFEWLAQQKIRIISPKTILSFIDEELIHDNDAILKQNGQMLHSMSSGERKQAYLQYVLAQKPDTLILDHFLDNLDTNARTHFSDLLKSQCEELHLINIYSRDDDHMIFLSDTYLYENDTLSIYDPTTGPESAGDLRFNNNHPIPKASKIGPEVPQELVEFKSVTISYLDKSILRDINWKVEKGQFWHLYGPNGSGKTTLLTMITGDNPKAYGQNIKLFGKQKGSGETIWEIKQKVGYFTTNMTFQFKRMQTAQEMVLSGFFDSIGLYQIAGDHQVKLANEWLTFIGLSHLAKQPFINLSMCHQRMIMIARAMVKHPPLLILDEASVDLDDESARRMSALINRIAHEGETTIIYVSHRLEPGLTPSNSFELIPGDEGSQGIVNSLN